MISEAAKTAGGGQGRRERSDQIS